MTDDLYYRKLENTSTTDLVDMIRERDKQISELEKENLYYKDTVETNTAEWEEQGQRVVALEKENAELRTKATALENANRAMVKELDDTTRSGLSVLENVVRSKEQLTKAKELIRKLIEAIHIWDCKNLEKVEAEAEQFISEVEK